MSAPSPPASKPRRRLITRRRLLVAGLIAAPIGEGLREAHALDTTRHEVRLPGLPARLDGLRVAQLTDLHRSDLVPTDWIEAVVQRCNALAPDLVVLTGDYVTHRATFAPSCAAALAGLRPPLGVYGVLGNHDYWAGAREISTELSRRGVRMLMNESRVVEGGLTLVGLDDSWAGRPDLRAALAGVPAGITPLLLTHNPQICHTAMVRPMLALCGHTHGGQIYIPGITEHFLRRIAVRDFVRGWYARGGGRIYVNRGIGMTAMPMRINSPPELSLFRLRAAPASDPLRVEGRPQAGKDPEELV